MLKVFLCCCLEKMFSILTLFCTVIVLCHGQFMENNTIPACPGEGRISCNSNSRYSNIDGSCNNLRAPWAGKASTPFKRYLPPVYQDNFGSPKITSADGATPLPNPRIISRLASSSAMAAVLQEQFYSHLLPAFGQFLAHDITLAQFATG
jgi:hypothetical protein